MILKLSDLIGQDLILLVEQVKLLGLFGIYVLFSVPATLFLKYLANNLFDLFVLRAFLEDLMSRL
jgi:hypothetical protein